MYDTSKKVIRYAVVNFSVLTFFCQWMVFELKTFSQLIWITQCVDRYDLSIKIKRFRTDACHMGDQLFFLELYRTIAVESLAE